MATAAANVTAYVYGMVQGGPPYIGSDPFARQIVFPQSVQMAFSTDNVDFWPTTQGVRFGNNYVYSVIEVRPSGLNQQSEKYASGSSVAQLVTGSQI